MHMAASAVEVCSRGTSTYQHLPSILLRVALLQLHNLPICTINLPSDKEFLIHVLYLGEGSGHVGQVLRLQFPELSQGRARQGIEEGWIT